MGKAEEYHAKRRNKAARKRLSNTVDFTHGIQAAKRRRKAGRRRICEGMCFTLPTPEDPFNDLYKEKILMKKAKRDQENGDNGIEVSKAESCGKKLRAKPPKAKDSTKTKKSISITATQRSEPRDLDGSLNKTAADVLSNDASRNAPQGSLHGQTSITTERFKWKPSCERCSKKDDLWTCLGGGAFEIALCVLVNAGIIKEEHESDGRGEHIKESEKVFMGSKQHWRFWEACGKGSDVLATGRATNTVILTGSVLAAVAHITARRVHQTLCSSPLMLFIAQSKEQTLQVRSIFKVLKPFLGLHSVSLHTGTPLQHQIEGLRSTPAEILIATPDRLCDLLNANAVSLLNISFMVVDGLEGIVSCGFSDRLLHIRAKVADNVQTVISSENISHNAHITCQKLLKEPICQVILDMSISQRSTWISQNVQVLVSEDRKLQKLHKIIRDYFENRENGATSGGLLVLFRQSQSLLKVKAAVQEEGYSVDCFLGDPSSKNDAASPVLEQFRNGQVEVLLSTEEYLGRIDLAAIKIVVYYEFPSSMDLYCQTLTRMARHTIKGILYSFCSGATAPLASQLVEVLKQCSQPVPSSLKMLVEAATLVEQKKP